jgi:protein required for attachment to host cells
MEVAMSRIRIIVADQAEAIFYDTPSLDARPKEVGRISDPLAHLQDRDLVSDRPGRAYESVGHARHAIARENDPRHQEAVRFARRISCRLDDALRRDEFDELVVVAGPPFLGLMRKELSEQARRRVVHTINKDLVHGPVESLRRHLPESAAELRPA